MKSTTNNVFVILFMIWGSSVLAADLPITSLSGPNGGEVMLTTTIPNSTTNSLPMPYGIGLRMEQPNGNSSWFGFDQNPYGQSTIRGGIDFRF